MTDAEIMERQIEITDKRLAIQTTKKILNNRELEAELRIEFEGYLNLLEAELKELLKPFTF